MLKVIDGEIKATIQDIDEESQSSTSIGFEGSEWDYLSRGFDLPHPSKLANFNSTEITDLMSKVNDDKKSIPLLEIENDVNMEKYIGKFN